jgi:Gpi18-like mannosyltransferase
VRAALLSAGLFLFNPSVIILSSVWGQTDSVIALLSVASFILLLKKKFTFAVLLFVAGILFKPNWIIFAPLFVFVFFVKHPNIKTIAYSFLAALVLSVLVSLPFSNNPLIFYPWLLKERILSTLNASPNASISAFNFYTTFLRIDFHLSTYRIIGIPVKFIGEFLFSGIYIFSFLYLFKRKVEMINLLKVVVFLGFGSFLFMPAMLERYFFPALIPFAILAVKNSKTFILYFTFTLALGLNIIWALFRRSNGVVNDIFSANDSLLIKIISIHNLVGFLALTTLLFKDNLLKLSVKK